MARKKIVSEEEVSKPAMAEETTEANADDGLIIRFEEETEKKFYDYNLLKEVTVAKDEDYDKLFE